MRVFTAIERFGPPPATYWQSRQPPDLTLIVFDLRFRRGSRRTDPSAVRVPPDAVYMA
jgi:hypothetical protein